jgi:hypothetical protein
MSRGFPRGAHCSKFSGELLMVLEGGRVTQLGLCSLAGLLGLGL